MKAAGVTVMHTRTHKLKYITPPLVISIQMQHLKFLPNYNLIILLLHLLMLYVLLLDVLQSG